MFENGICNLLPNCPFPMHHMKIHVCSGIVCTDLRPTQFPSSGWLWPPCQTSIAGNPFVWLKKRYVLSMFPQINSSRTRSYRVRWSIIRQSIMSSLENNKSIYPAHIHQLFDGKQSTICLKTTNHHLHPISPKWFPKSEVG